MPVAAGSVSSVSAARSSRAMLTRLPWSPRLASCWEAQEASAARGPDLLRHGAVPPRHLGVPDRHRGTPPAFPASPQVTAEGEGVIAADLSGRSLIAVLIRLHEAPRKDDDCGDWALAAAFYERIAEGRRARDRLGRSHYDRWADQRAQAVDRQQGNMDCGLVLTVAREMRHIPDLPAEEDAHATAFDDVRILPLPQIPTRRNGPHRERRHGTYGLSPRQVPRPRVAGSSGPTGHPRTARADHGTCLVVVPAQPAQVPVVRIRVTGHDRGERRELADRQAERFAAAHVPPFGEEGIGQYGEAADLQQHTGIGHARDGDGVVAHAGHVAA